MSSSPSAHLQPKRRSLRGDYTGEPVPVSRSLVAREETGGLGEGLGNEWNRPGLRNPIDRGLRRVGHGAAQGTGKIRRNRRPEYDEEARHAECTPNWESQSKITPLAPSARSTRNYSIDPCLIGLASTGWTCVRRTGSSPHAYLFNCPRRSRRTRRKSGFKRPAHEPRAVTARYLRGPAIPGVLRPERR